MFLPDPIQTNTLLHGPLAYARACINSEIKFPIGKPSKLFSKKEKASANELNVGPHDVWKVCARANGGSVPTAGMTAIMF